ncbi:SulP family inorganic anion transporter, partial [Klebsiella pneumoniae]|uniref:SulP family inorganic anion transporter n=1 Tax=Klebsiella pneumoniae TaxID=573 RepID=UPI001914F15A
TLGLSALTLAIYLVIKRWQPRWPAAMFAIMVAALLVWALNLESVGVQVVGVIQGGLPEFQAPAFDLGISRELVMPALNLAMVSIILTKLTIAKLSAGITSSRLIPKSKAGAWNSGKPPWITP